MWISGHLVQPLPIRATGGEKASHLTPIGKYNFDYRMANAKPRISREAENLYDQCHQTRLQSPLEGGTWVWVSTDLGQGVRYRVRPWFHCFLYHYCLQILYTTNFLIKNVFCYLFHGTIGHTVPWELLFTVSV